MKIILQKTVDRLGDPGDVADVADGYARNYLIPRGLAVRAEKGTLRHAESLKRAHEVRTSAQRGDFEALSVQAGVSVDRRDIHLDDPIRSVGTHEVTVHLHAEVDPVVTIDVRPQD